MYLWSIAIAYRLGLGFHALNNEGADGGNLMQPRRIDVGPVTYDGISGEILRRHMLENFVRTCQASDDGSLPVLPLSEGLHPDRGPIGIRAAAKLLSYDELTTANLYESTRRAIQDCAVLDVGGFLAAFGKEEADDGKYIAEREYLKNHCAKSGNANPVKRESCFDVGWLISEEPQDLTVTQHSAYRDTAVLNSRYAQTMRSNTYGGLVRADLHRVGTDDNWYLLNSNRLAVSEDQRRGRQVALVESIVDFIAAPTGARVAAWAPHVFLTEGVVLLTSVRTAPFASPIRVDLANKERPVGANVDYVTTMMALGNDTDTWTWTFRSAKELLDAGKSVSEKLRGQKCEATGFVR